MSQYTTGELAKRCGVTVRTVQYYDGRGILTPSALSEGGRRLYSEQDAERLAVICFLRELGLPIESIKQLLHEDDFESVVTMLLEQQAMALKEEISEREEQLTRLEALRKGLKAIEEPSVESIGDIARTMRNRDRLKKIHRTLLLTGLPVTLLQWAGIALWIVKGRWWLFAVWLAVAVIYAIMVVPRYFRRMAYVCPKCHKVFAPGLKDAFFARHTPYTRRLRCVECGHVGFCVEVAREEG